MKKHHLLLLIPLFFLLGCESQDMAPNAYNIIPLPAQLDAQEGKFFLNKDVSILCDIKDEAVQKAAEDLASSLSSTTSLPIKSAATGGDKHTISFQINSEVSHAEGYSLSIEKDQIQLAASEGAGLFYGIQSLKQLLQETDGKWFFPACKITDAPRFPYRGMHLDVARHFFDVAAVKRYIDQLAYHKMNRFHWHLTEDQGWRIEIKKYPKLTEVAAFRDGTLIGHYSDKPHQFDGKRYGGFYTQEEIKEVVAYAAERFITVVPEIEMPGHAQAAIAAYPEFGCTDEQLEVLQKWGVSENVYCPKEETFAFLEDVLTEVIDLFPGEYIHIGGDECPKTQWKQNVYCQELMKKEGLKDEHELQSYFIKRIEKFVNSKGRQIIGWDEILEGGLAPNAAVMSWRGVQGGIEAAKSGHDVVMTPTSHCYLDYYQSDHPDEPLAIGGYLPLEKVYSYEPVPPELNEEESKHIKGAQVNLWTEYIPTVEQLDYMTFPRLCALSEVVWSRKDQRDLLAFTKRLSTHIDRLQAMGINSANHMYDMKSAIQPKEGKVEVDLFTHAPNSTIRYSLDGSEPVQSSPLFENPLQIDSSVHVRAKAFKADGSSGREVDQKIKYHLAAGKSIQLAEQPHDKYKGGGNGSIINGVDGSDSRYGDAEWLGFDGKDFEAVIDLGNAVGTHHDVSLQAISEITFRFYKGEGQWIYLPKQVQIFSSNDGEAYEEVATKSDITGEGKATEVTIAFEKTNSRYLKIVAKNHGIIADGKQGAGHPAWLFVDEIRVN
jgi:hexosaminidase